ncbi:MAG: hypothetical protein AAFY71_22115 [Bacteroidota bacterium]
MKFTLAFLCLLLAGITFAQQTSISYELNGRASNQAIEDSVGLSNNPFAQFIGEWALKDETWIQNWGGENDTIKIPGHHTVIAKINTDNSILSIVDGPEPNGHIFWSYNPNTGEVGHLSSFGNIRAGVGKGAFYGKQNLRLKVSFEGEAKGTYRMYTYEWINKNEYALLSIQYNEKDQPTGLFYKGNFVRISKNQSLKEEIETVLSILDDNKISKEEQIRVYAEDIVHMAPNNKVITDKKALLDYLKEQERLGHSEMKHQMIEYSEHGDVVIMRGQVKGIFYAKEGGDGYPFQTKNLFVFKKEKGDLKITKVIYNMPPN